MKEKEIKKGGKIHEMKKKVVENEKVQKGVKITFLIIYLAMVGVIFGISEKLAIHFIDFLNYIESFGVTQIATTFNVILVAIVTAIYFKK